ncbi:MAG: carbohydrate kinase family protein [Calditrichia bacterium]
MMKAKLFQVFGLGQCSLDYIGKIESYPQPDSKCEFTDLVVQGGGPVATALVALSRWDVSCTFGGVVGDDVFGSKIKSSLEEEGVDTGGLLVRKGFESQFAFILAEPGVGRRTVFWRRPTGPPPGVEEINYKVLRQAKVFHTDGLFAEASVAACKSASEAGVTVVVDAGSMRDGMIEIARYSDYFLASSTFADAFAGKNQPLKACYKLAELGPRVVAVTMGEKGYIALHENKVIEKPAYPANAMDTTGCGDVFHAGFIFGLLKKWPVEKCLDFAAWAAAMVSTKMGGRSGIPNVEQWEKR